MTQETSTFHSSTRYLHSMDSMHRKGSDSDSACKHEFKIIQQEIMRKCRVKPKSVSKKKASKVGKRTGNKLNLKQIKYCPSQRVKGTSKLIFDKFFFFLFEHFHNGLEFRSNLEQSYIKNNRFFNKDASMNQNIPEALESMQSEFTIKSKAGLKPSLLRKVTQLKSMGETLAAKEKQKPRSPSKPDRFALEFEISQIEGVYSPKIDHLFSDFTEEDLNELD